ncbi:integrase [Methanosarcina acetivorans C2A]|uniref:Integrase n=1 Tax=Methanosarcina acetivorans (strain ATCC 35395 / DSM 2834 / JCM 12185 / C2A) TaxID=188937 RepID=Q8TTS4_METAC|nr:integrase [Methanosarcina acetivorans C2A]
MCFIPKLFRAKYVGCNPLSFVKLNGKKIRWIIAQKSKGESTSTIAEIQGISARRVQQIYKEYVETGQLPQVGINLGRPKNPLSSSDKELIDQTYSDYKFGACYLEILIEGKYNRKISHNRIHNYLLSMDLAKENRKKKQRRKWCRYEREHSMSAAHIDWHENPLLGLQVCAILDDSSRMIIAGGEYVHCNTENTIKVIDELVKEYWDIYPLRELIMDHGSEFGAHRINKDGSWDSDFKRCIEELGIKPILARVRHPQTNGKIEKWFDTYQRFRGEFESFEEFVQWYNKRPHGALKLEQLESPQEAFWNRLPVEAKFRIGVRLFGW